MYYSEINTHINNTKILSLNTNLTYIIKVDNPQEKIKIDLTTNEIYKFRTIQGEIEEQSVIANGNNLQSFNFGSEAQVENDEVQQRADKSGIAAGQDGAGQHCRQENQR